METTNPHPGKADRRYSRRTFLGTAALGAIAPTARTSATHGESSGYIDAHVHIWTPDNAKYPLAPQFSPKDMKPASFTPEQLFAHCRPEGVSRIVLIQMSFYGFDNRYMLDMIAEHRGVFSGVGIIDETAPSMRRRMRGLRRNGVRGFRVSAGTRNVDACMGTPGMAEMWRVAADEDLSICPLINPEALPAIDKMSGRFPQTSVVIDHFARIGMTGPIRRADLDRLLRLSTHRRIHVKLSAFYALGEKKPPYLDAGQLVRELRDAFGPERLMWASDCPYQVNPGHNYHDSIGLIRDRLDFLKSEDKTWMLTKTAERVFFG
jgi:predicted TIM-barrel fold metal-dependent hydrolase